MEEDERNEQFTLFLLLIICFFLVIVDLLEMNDIIHSWNYGVTIIGETYESCIKWELYTKTAYGLFSLLGATSAFILTAFILVDRYWFLKRVMHSFLWFNYLIFGPYMLGFCLIGFYNWNNVVYSCDKSNYKVKNITLGNVFSLIGCFFISLSVSLLVGISNTIILYIYSILRKPRGNIIIRKLFWWFVFKNNDPITFIRNTVSQEGNNNNV